MARLATAPTHVVVDSWSTSRVAMARREGYAGSRSPYVLHPEREQYQIVTLYERPNGSRYIRRQHVSAWGGRTALGIVTQEELPG